MEGLWLPALVALFLWWFGTGAVLLLDRLPRASRRAGVLGATVVAVFALWVIWLTADIRGAGAALAAFAAALAVWGWHEVTFLAGLITGPRREACPPEATGWPRFRLAAATLIHHEVALALTALALTVWLWDAANPVAVCTFLLLWILRLSSKFNLFLGAPYVADEFLPDDLRYLGSYFNRRSISPLLPLSVTVGTAFAAVCAVRALDGADAFAQTAWALAGTLTALGVLEHWFMVLPCREAALWRWWMETRGRRAARMTEPVSGAPMGLPAGPGR
jgi:putative photosynthetic complex assembly protein 2